MKPTPSHSSSVPDSVPSGSRRFLSVDALRGFDMFLIVGADEFVYALDKMSDHPVVRFLGSQLNHKDWAGFAFYDLIFPLFVFLVGVSIVFSLTKIIAREGRFGAYKRIGRRFLILYALAIIYYGGFAHAWPDIRLVGVLNRIALCYLFAGLLFCHLNWRGLAGVCAGLLLGYWALMSFVPFPDVRPVDERGQLVSQTLTATNVSQLNFSGTRTLRGVFQPGLNLANYLDQKYLPGFKWDKTWDPEGLLSTFPAIASCLLGVLAGLLLVHPGISDQRKVFWLLGGGAAGVLAGFLWGLNFPVIKKIWTSSYVLVAGGYSALLLGAFYQIIEIWKYQRWARMFLWIGANSITLYLAANLIEFPQWASRLVGGDIARWLNTHVTQGLGELLISIVSLGLIVGLARFLYQRKIFLRV
jgi:predicted acyltransferase